MTREEAIEWMIFQKEQVLAMSGDKSGTLTVAYDMAIEALQRENAEVNGYCHRLRPSNVEVVVRCKDCTRGYGSPVCPIQSDGWTINQDTFYCAWGER